MISKNHKIVVFGTPTCVYCKKVVSYFKQNQIRFNYVDVSKNETALRDMVRKSGQQGVPQLWIDGKVVMGFDVNKINKMLNIRR